MFTHSAWFRKGRSGQVLRIDEDYAVPQGDDGTAAAFAKALKATSLFYEWTMAI
jgi:hypothetical protein